YGSHVFAEAWRKESRLGLRESEDTRLREWRATWRIEPRGESNRVGPFLRTERPPTLSSGRDHSATSFVSLRSRPITNPTTRLTVRGLAQADDVQLGK